MNVCPLDSYVTTPIMCETKIKSVFDYISEAIMFDMTDLINM